jgi:hypothetical protein
MTATITPPANARERVRDDPLLRLRDYEAALRFYVTLLGPGLDRIVFAENSSSDLSSLARICEEAGKRDAVEFISFYGLDYPPEYGRGYGEFRLLDYAMDHSTALGAFGPRDVIWKVTGRYIVRNLLDLFRTIPRSFDLYCDLRDRPMPWMDTRLFAVTRGGYDRLIRGTYSRLAESELRSSPEKEMRRHIGSLLPTGGIIPRFCTEPLVDGIRGNDGQNYARGKNLAKYMLRAAARKIAPFLWI